MSSFPEAYGDYTTFDHEPTQEEIAVAAHSLLLGLAHYIEERAIIKYNLGGYWTVGIKFYLQKLYGGAVGSHEGVIA